MSTGAVLGADASTQRCQGQCTRARSSLTVSKPQSRPLGLRFGIRAMPVRHELAVRGRCRRGVARRPARP